MLWVFVLGLGLVLFKLSLPRNLAAKNVYNTSSINLKLKETAKNTAESIVSFLGSGLHPKKTAQLRHIALVYRTRLFTGY